MHGLPACRLFMGGKTSGLSVLQKNLKCTERESTSKNEKETEKLFVEYIKKKFVINTNTRGKMTRRKQTTQKAGSMSHRLHMHHTECAYG